MQHATHCAMQYLLLFRIALLFIFFCFVASYLRTFLDATQIMIFFSNLTKFIVILYVFIFCLVLFLVCRTCFYIRFLYS